jgi:3-hydroxybutyryl-CoA dehydratase
VGNYFFEDLSVGMSSERSYQFTDQRVALFSSLVDDMAPVHMDSEYARNQGFDGKIVHGLFVQSIISGILGNEIPGPRSVINSLNMKMHNPVLVGEMVNYHVEITSLTPSVAAVSLHFQGLVDGKVAISGKALCCFPNVTRN